MRVLKKDMKSITKVARIKNRIVNRNSSKGMNATEENCAEDQ